MQEYPESSRFYQMPLDGSAPPSPAGSAPPSPSKSSKFSWGFGRKSRTPSPNASIFAGRDDEANDGTRGRKASASPSSFVVKSVIRQPGGVSLDAQGDNGTYMQSPSSPNGAWSPSATDPSQQFGPDGGAINGHNESYKRQKSRPVMSLGVPAGGPGGGVGYGGANSSNDGRPEAEMRYAAATNAGALPAESSFPPNNRYPSSSPTRPSSPGGGGGGISAQQFQRKVRDRQNSIQSPREPRQASPVVGTRRAADIAAEARANSRDAGWTREPDLTSGRTGNPAQGGGQPLPPSNGPPFSPSHRASPIAIPHPSGRRGDHDDASPFGTPSPGFSAISTPAAGPPTKSALGRKPVPQMGSQDDRAAEVTPLRTQPPPGGDRLSRLENMLTPAQRIIQETRSRQLAQERTEADQTARATVAQAAALSQQTATQVLPTTPQSQSISPVAAADKGKARQMDRIPDHDLRNAGGEIPVRRGSKKSPTKQVQILAAPAGPAAPSPPRTGPSTPSGPARNPSAAAEGSRMTGNLMPGAGPLPKDMSMTDALQEMMIRFYRFERYSIPLLRSLETRLVDIERDAQIAIHQTDALSANSARDREMDLWVSEMTGMMKHEIGQLRAACGEIKEGREIVARVAQRMHAKDAEASETVSTKNVPTNANAKPLAPPSAGPTRTPATIAAMSVPVPPASVTTGSELSDASGTRKVPGSTVSAVLPPSTLGTSHKVPLTPATLKAVPRPDVRSVSPSSVTADPGLGVGQKTEPKPLLLPVNKVETTESKVSASHQTRQTNISSASFQSTIPVLPAPDRDILADFLADTAVNSPSVDAAARRAAPAAIPAADRRSPSPNSKGRPRYTSALGGSVLDSTTRTRSPERASVEVLARPIATTLYQRADSPGAPPSEADTSRSTQSVENRLKALLRGPESAAAVLEKSPTMTEAELEEEIMSNPAASPPVTEHLRWRSKESTTSDFSTPDPTIRSGTPSTPNGALHKESFFSGFAQGGGRATPPLSSSPEKTGVFGLAPNRHLKASSSSSLATGSNINIVATTTSSVRSGTLPVQSSSPSTVSGSVMATRGILRNPSPTRLNVASTQPVMASPSKQTTSPGDFIGVPSEKVDDITTATHASDTLRARATSYLKASAATEPVAEGLSPKPGSWAAPRFPASTPLGDAGTSSSLSTSSSAGAIPASFDAKTRREGLPGSAVRASTWLASDSTNTNTTPNVPKGAGGTGPWGTSQYRRSSNVGAVGANATLREKLAFFDAQR
ncbi:hypothetical protein CF326_g974 [Tilletia indica]|nr:hypothetical protein CF326_g974 [Tilletia indica]